MAPITVYSWIFSMIILNHGIITVTSFPITIDGLFEFGLNLLMDSIFNLGDEEPEGLTMEDLGSKIDNMEKTIINSEKTIIRELRHAIKYNTAIRDFTKSVTYINDLFTLFQTYSVGWEDRTLRNFAELCLTVGDNGLTYKLHDLVENVSPSTKHTTSLLALVAEPFKRAKSAAERCDDISVQQEVYNMYGEISTYIIKGYTMIFNAYKILHKMKEGSFKREKAATRELYKKAMYRITKSAVAALRVSPRDVRSCDPGDDEEGETYIELKWLFNSLVTTEAFLYQPKLGSDYQCVETCDYFDWAWIQRYHYERLDLLQECSGNVYSCRDSDKYYYCPTTSSDRRFDDLANSPDEIKNCEAPIHVSDKFPAVRRTTTIFYNCYYCVCICDDFHRPDTMRKFSLAPVQSDSTNNKKMIELKEADVPIDAENENIVNVDEHASIEFQVTDWNKNFSQTTVPFIDAQPVFSDPSRPLSGAGLYFKGQTGYGGFIGFKLVAYNYAVVLAKTLFSLRSKLESIEESGEDSSEETEEDTYEETEEEKQEEMKNKATDTQLDPAEEAEKIEAGLGYEFDFEIPDGTVKKVTKKVKKGLKFIRNKGRRRNQRRKHSHKHSAKHLKMKKRKFG